MPTIIVSTNFPLTQDRLGFVKESIRLAAECGADVCVIHNADEHEWPEYYIWAKEFKIQLTMPVYSKKQLDIMMPHAIPFCYFPYFDHDRIELKKLAINSGHRVICGYNMWDVNYAEANEIKLYSMKEAANTSHLNNYYTPFMIDFDGIFKPYGPFDGFSSTCLGVHQELDAIDAGAEYLLLHMRINGPGVNEDCFHKPVAQVEKLIRMVKR